MRLLIARTGGLWIIIRDIEGFVLAAKTMHVANLSDLLFSTLQLCCLLWNLIVELVLWRSKLKVMPSLSSVV